MNSVSESDICEPCRGGVPPMTRAEALEGLAELPGWALEDGPPMRIVRHFHFPDFRTAQDFAVAVGTIAEAAGHHPDIHYGWGSCAVSFYTHKINGLHRNDFIMAAKVNAIVP